MIINGLQKVVKVKHPISKEVVKNKCYVKYVFWNTFKKLYKTI